MQAVGRQSFIIVFDFDHTVVDCNTDEVIPAYLGRGDVWNDLRKTGMQWTKLMDTVIAPFTKEELTEAAHKSVVMDPEMPAVFEFLRSLQMSGNVNEQRALYELKRQQQQKRKNNNNATVGVDDMIPSFLEIHIASDANSHFIDASLEARLPFVREGISQIHTNPYYDLRDTCHGGAQKQEDNNNDEVERDAKYNAGLERKSRVRWYEPQGHDCECCASRGKPNMCKSYIIQRILSTTSAIDPTIVFIGDGANDYCPILNTLRPRDFMFARRGFPIHQILSTQVPSDRAPGGCCSIGLWSDARELLNLFHMVMEHPTVRLPTLVRLRDAGPLEFRSITTVKRFPAILQRVLEDPANASSLSAAGRVLMLQLIEAARSNGAVAPLLGQSAVPAWLRNFAYTSEYDRHRGSGGRVSVPQDCISAMPGADLQTAIAGVAPRWGQLPWLHGEIYLYHLVWQYMMLTEEGAKALLSGDRDGTGAVVARTIVNAVSPHALSNPLHVSEEQEKVEVISAPAVAHQTVGSPDYLLCEPLRTAEGVVVHVRDVSSATDSEEKETRVVPLAAITPGEGRLNESLIPSRDVCFRPYTDIYGAEKLHLLTNFLQVRVLPMLLCEPWVAGIDFVAVLVRWMLWGNGLDLSMFTMEQLSASHAKPSSAAAITTPEDDAAAKVERLRSAEATAAMTQDSHLVGCEVQGVVEYLKQHVQSAKANTKREFVNQLDIVMDNVGVECVADLCLALWFLHEAHNTAAPPRVTLHVKNMPYYVSDVTPPDFHVLLETLENEAARMTNEAGAATSSSPSAETATVHKVEAAAALRSFAEKVKTAMKSGRVEVEADTVWTQPSEYRDLPPRVVNRFFYSQCIVPRADPAAQTNVETNVAMPPAAAERYVYRANKQVFIRHSSLVIFKGDLNFRRLIGDRYWDRSDFLSSLPADAKASLDTSAASYTPEQRAITDDLLIDTPGSQAMDSPAFQEVVNAYWPTHVLPVCAIRTIKSECCLGVPAETKKRLDAEVGKEWRVSGKYGVILFAHS